MIGLAVGLSLILSLVVVHVWVQRTPLPKDRPLDCDTNLPLPWAGYASSVFSLTALFGSYFAILVLIGTAALAGVAAGSILALLWLSNHLANSQATSFHRFLLDSRFAIGEHYNNALSFLLVLMLLGFAISEVVILRDLAIVAFSMPPRHATMFALTLALVAYLYCLAGGYGALYRTDVIQYVFVVFMAVTLGGALLLGNATFSSQFLVPLAPDFWSLGVSIPTPIRLTLTFAVGLLVGFCFVVANPDIWKRVFIVIRVQPRKRLSLAAFIGAGAVPFLLLLPAAAVRPDANLTSIQPFDAFAHLSPNRFLVGALALGMVSSFLSSFDSALLSAVHLRLAGKERSQPSHGRSLPAFRIMMALLFAALAATTLTLLAAVGNPYLMAALLLVLFAVVGGTVVGTNLLQTPMRSKGFPWFTTLVVVAWTTYILNIEDALLRPSPQLIKAFPFGMAVFVAFAIGARARLNGRRENDD